MEVGKTILSQLKSLGMMDLMAWGARSYKVFNDKQLLTNSLGGLVFTVSGLKHKGQVLVSLNARDLYDVKIGKLTSGKWETKAEASDVFVEDLVQEIDNLIEGYYKNGKSVYDSVNLFKKV